MSLATAGGGLGGLGGGGAAAGGLTMAHQASAVARPMAPTPPSGSIPDGGIPPPSSAVAALGADLVDKNQQLSLQQVRDLSRMPLVAVDLYATEPHVAGFPPKPKDADEAESLGPYLVGKMKDKVALKTTEASHKTFRKWLSQTKGYIDLKADVFARLDDDSAIVIESPQHWLGLRRLEDAPKELRKKVNCDDSTSPAIAEETSQEIGITMANGTLDGSIPQGDDFDRVVGKVRLHASKKALTVLPEELTGLLMNMARHHVARYNEVGEEDDDIDSYPCCVAVPAIYCNDSSVESLLDATGGTGVIFQRSICALEGALLPSPDQNKPNMLLAHLSKVLQEMHKEHQTKLLKNPDLVFEDDMLLLLTGVTKDCAECTAVQISAARSNGMWGQFKVLTNVSYRHEKPESIIDKCISELFDTLDTVAPEAGAPVAMVSYGTSSEQKTIETKWDRLKKSLEDWEQVPYFSSRPEAVALGIAVMGAVSHGRITTTVHIPGKKPKADLAVQVHNVAPVAVGVMMNYHGGAEDKWLPVKTIFDFDRRVPAGPYQIDLVAAECAVYRSNKKELSEEALLKAIKDNEGARSIPIREEAALNLRVQVLQKLTRDGEWKKIGDVMSPLVSLDKDEKKIACEKVVLELSLGPTGLITQALAGERESVVQANTSARNSTIRYYLGIFLAIAFFGGFLVKSWWEDHVFERDTRRLLAYYKHVIPGSLSDGDLHNARYLVYKYRHKKEKLWKNLEKKYGVPVLQEDEWADNGSESSEADGEEENLDVSGGSKNEESNSEEEL